TPIVSIGGERSGRIGALVRARPVMLSDGTLVVGHAGEGLLYFNPTGELVKTGGRQGSGPGEIVSNAVRVQRIRGDSVIVMDRAGSRVSVFTADGEFAEYVNTRGDPAPFFIGRLEDGSFLALNSSGYPATRVGEISRDTFHLW